MAKMCLPLDFMASPSDIALALTEPRARMTPLSARSAHDATTVAARLQNAEPPSPGASRGASRAPAETAPPLPLSGTQVLLSAAAFAALACGVGMWFVH
jgi:hypothetical protein